MTNLPGGDFEAGYCVGLRKAAEECEQIVIKLDGTEKAQLKATYRCIEHIRAVLLTAAGHPGYGCGHVFKTYPVICELCGLVRRSRSASPGAKRKPRICKACHIERQNAHLFPHKRQTTHLFPRKHK